jgi:hypothetical protein
VFALGSTFEQRSCSFRILKSNLIPWEFYLKIMTKISPPAIISEKEMPLYYPRSELLPGDLIRETLEYDQLLVDCLDRTDEVCIYFTFKLLGDSLLALSVAQACHDYLSLTRKNKYPKIVLHSTNAPLLLHCPIFRNAQVAVDIFSPSLTRKVLLTDSEIRAHSNFEYVYATEAYNYPRFYEVTSSGAFQKFPSRPSRYYLTFERAVGTVLLSDPNTSVPFLVFENDSILKEMLRRELGIDFIDNPSLIYCALVATTNLPKKKQFGIKNFLTVAKEISRHFSGRIFHFILIVSRDKSEVEKEEIKNELQLAKRSFEISVCHSSNLELLGYLLSRCQLIIGNDTGLSHLATISRSNLYVANPVIILYSRHDYSKWTAGTPNVTPIYTEFSEYLRLHCLSPIRDKIDDSEWGDKALASSIPVENVTRLATDLLSARINSF